MIDKFDAQDGQDSFKRSVHSRPIRYIRDHLHLAISLRIHRDDELNEGDSRGNRSEYGLLATTAGVIFTASERSKRNDNKSPTQPALQRTKKGRDLSRSARHSNRTKRAFRKITPRTHSSVAIYRLPSMQREPPPLERNDKLHTMQIVTRCAPHRYRDSWIQVNSTARMKENAKNNFHFDDDSTYTSDRLLPAYKPLHTMHPDAQARQLDIT